MRPELSELLELDEGVGGGGGILCPGFFTGYRLEVGIGDRPPAAEVARRRARLAGPSHATRVATLREFRRATVWRGLGGAKPSLARPSDAE